MVSKNLKHFEKLFESNDNLLRTHKSWIVNSAFIKEYSIPSFRITFVVLDI